MKKIITFFAVLAALTSAAFAGYVPEGYEQVTPDFDVDWSADDYYFDFSYFEENAGTGNDGELGVTVTNWYTNTSDKSGIVVGEPWLFNANSDYCIFFKIDGLTYENVMSRGTVRLCLSGYPTDDLDDFYENGMYEIDEDLRDGIYGEYRVSYGKDFAEDDASFEANLRDFVENGVVISFADIANQFDSRYGDKTGWGWHSGMYDRYPDGNFIITGVRVEITSETDWDPYPYQPGVSKPITYLPTGTTNTVQLRLVRKTPEAEIPEPAAYAYGVMGLVSLVGMKKRFGK